MATKPFFTAAEMAEHLRDLVDDDDFIDRAVRVHFPDWKAERSVRRVMAVDAKRKSPANDPRSFMADTAHDVLQVNTYKSVAETLWRAIHREHPRKMRELHDYGEAVRAMGKTGPVVVWP